MRSLVMHAAVGTALGGVTTLVGEPQNLLIGTVAGWDFIEFFVRMAPVSLPVLAVGLTTCVLLEHFRWFGYGERVAEPVRRVLEDFDAAETEKRTGRDRAILVVQALVAGFLVIALAFHWAAVGLIGLTEVINAEVAVAIAMTSTALGTLLPILRDSGLLSTSLGSTVLRHGAYGELGPIVAIADLREAALVQLVGFDAVSDGEGFIEIAAPLAPDRFAGVVWNAGTRQTTVWRLERVGQQARRGP